MGRLALLGLVVVGCSEARGLDRADASSLAQEPSAISILRTHHLASASGFRSGAIDVLLPARADRPLKVMVPGRAGAWLEIVAEGVQSVAPRVAGRAVVHENALPATALVHVADPDRVEELRVLRSAAAPSKASWTIARGPDITTLRLNGARVEAIDARNQVVISSEPIVAIDARDVTRTPKVRIEGDRLIVELDTAGLEYPIVLDPAWITTTPSTMLTGRASPFMSKLADGRVFVIGGVNWFPPDVYDPPSDTWAPHVSTQDTLYAHLYGSNVVALPTGKVLLKGYCGAGGTLSNAELYDPVALKATATGPVPDRCNATATVVPSANKVVIAGGSAGTGTSTIEYYDIGTGTFTAVTPTLLAGRYSHVAALLTTGPNAGKILIAGGRNSPALSTAELLDPTTWTATATANKMSEARVEPSITLLTKGPNAGKYLIAGGWNASSVAVSTTDLYDPATNQFTAGPSMTSPRFRQAALSLADGRVLVAGGYSFAAGAALSAVEVLDPTSGTFTALTSLPSGRDYPSLIELSGGRVLLVGGNDAHSLVYWPDPVTCSSGASCPTGNCVDGYCCDSACAGQCSACDVAGRQGICSPVSGDAPHGARTACTPYLLCAAGACTTSCASDAACATGSYCDTPSKTCLVKKPNGSGCGVGGECTSGSCVDGYCCNSSCVGTCSACDVAGSPGVCTTIVGTPHGSRACPSPYACSSSGSCASGSCSVDSDCAAGRFCQGGACVAKLADGVACTADTNCAKGNCVDGVCCATKCTNNCQACDVPGKLGTCSNVDSGPPHSTRTCAPYLACNLGACATSCATTADCSTGYCSASKCVGGKSLGQPCGTGSECTSGLCADGVCCSSACTSDCGSCSIAGLEGTCSPKPAAATCGTSGCSGAQMVTPGHCSGTTTSCVYGSATPCAGSLVCADATSCKTGCTIDADCTTGACDTSTGKCTTPDGGISDASVPDSEMPETTTDSGAIAEEPAPIVDPHPTVAGFTRCANASECSTGFCVDGVCCDTACEDKCHSCALLSSPGKCTLSPIGVDLRSDCGPANTCLGTCDGKGQCIGAGTGTMCGRNRCVGPSNGVGPAYCPSAGAKCPTEVAVPFDCAPYICETAFGACRTECVSSSDCANGFVCDVGSKTCTALAPAEDGGGCAFTARTAKSSFAGIFALLALSVVRRRRARRGVTPV